MTPIAAQWPSIGLRFTHLISIIDHFERHWSVSKTESQTVGSVGNIELPFTANHLIVSSVNQLIYGLIVNWSAIEVECRMPIEN